MLGCAAQIPKWENLPPAHVGVPVLVETADEQNPIALHIVRLTTPLVRYVELPLEKIVITISLKIVQETMIGHVGMGAFRCGPIKVKEVEIPPWGCIAISTQSSKFSDSVLQAMIAHELGHLQLGHKGHKGYDLGNQMEIDADLAGIVILNKSGICGKKVMQQSLLAMLKEISEYKKYQNMNERKKIVDQLPGDC